MANRRIGQGMGGRPFYSGGGSGGGGGAVNPWEGGNVPGGNRGGMMNSFNSGNQSNILSQLSEPQAQLALALTKLLQPQQQQVPSLLTMDTVNPLASNTMYPNDYPQRGRLDFNRRPRPDFRRNEPFNKMHRGRDSDHNRRRDSSKPSGKGSAGNKNKNSSVKASSKTSGKDEVKSKEEKTSETSTDKDKNAEERTETENQDGDEKRDWKDEKNTDGKKEEGAEEGDEDDENKDDKDKTAATNGDTNKKTDKKIKDGKYTGIPTHFLNCRICKKRMWDGESFEKHMNGRAHQQMFEKVEESYRLKANMMRESIRLIEDKNSIEIDRMKRLGKKMKVQQRSHCAMCDLDFFGYLFAHRKSASHQKLKQFLHPRCNYCNKEFPTRMEWENHRHTPEHFLKKFEVLGKESEKEKGQDIVEDDEEIEELDAMGDDDMPDDNDVILELADDLEDIKNRIPMYTSKRAVGTNMVTQATGYSCQPCGQFFLSKDRADKHCRSETHYKSFVKILNEKHVQAEDKKRKQLEEENDEGNWKRRKIADSENENTEEQDDQDKEQDESKNEKDGNDLYDPADSFMSTDPNDVVLDTTTENPDTSEMDNDKTWESAKDVEMMDTTTEEESQEVAKSTPVKPKPATRTPRGRKGKKGN